MRVEVLFSPAEFESLPRRELGAADCVVFDILRATSSLITALAHGAASVVPVPTIDEALALRRADPAVLLAGERDGVRIEARLTGGIEFDLGNSPREFVAERVRGRRIAMTTTNGTRALRACRGAARVWAAALLNLSATARRLLAAEAETVVIVCSGTYEEAALEDTLAAGALCDRLAAATGAGAELADSAEIARLAYLGHCRDLLAAMRSARNGRRLLSLPALSGDVPACFEMDRFDGVGLMDAAGGVRWEAGAGEAR